MNKKIKEQAGQMTVLEINGVPILHYYAKGDGWVAIEQLMEKFAELIVRECIHVALRDALPTWDNAAPETCEQSVKIAADLKEHFGVEE